MDKLIFLFLVITFSSFGQKRGLDIDKHLWGENREIVNSFLHAGQKDFFFVDRMYPGLMYQKYDSCKDESFIKFILIKTEDSKKYEFTKYDNCGQTRMAIDSKALRFFDDNRNQIMADSIIEVVDIDHTIFYSLYEFKNGSLKAYKYFCKECVDWDKDKSTRERNQNLKLYKFFIALDNELSGLIK